MNRNYNLKLDLQFRCNNSIMKFNQFDNNTSDFFVRITNSGNLVDIEKAIVVLATIKPSGKVASQFVEVENGLVYADLKPSMKDEIGTYTAKAMIILENERVVTDPISYEVEEDKIFSLLNDTVETAEDFTLLTDMLSRLSTIEINEANRENNFNNIKEQFEIIKNNHNELVTTQTSKRVDEIIQPVVEENVKKHTEKVINELSDKVVIVDSKIEEVEEFIENKNSVISNTITNANNKVDEAINKIPPKSELIGPKGEKGDTPSIAHLETSINNKINEVETRFNALTSKQQQDAEVIDARVDFKGVAFDSLKERIDYTDKLLRDSTVSTVTTESDFTTVEATSNGYFEDVKLEGKTLVVNSDNEVVEPGTDGAMLKSVGDGVDEIVVSSVNNNLYDGNAEIGTISISTGTNLSNSARIRTGFIPIGNVSNLLQSMYTDNLVQINTFFYDANKKYISKTGTKTGAHILLDIPQDTKYVRAIYKLVSDTDVSNEDVVAFKNSLVITSDLDGRTYIPHKQDKKTLLYYNEETQTWEKPILREWDSIEKHADGKYYYHQRSGEVVLNGSEVIGTYSESDSNDVMAFTIKIKNNSVAGCICDRFMYKQAHGSNANYENIFNSNDNYLQIRILKSKLSTQDVQGFKQWLQANNVTVVYQLAEEKVYECTNIDLITYSGETNFIVESGVLSPKTTLKVHNNISNVVSLLQKKVSLLESNVKASQEVQDMMILETDMRMLDIELALMEFIPMTLNLGGSNMLRSATYFNFLKNHIINETYEKEYLENVINKYLATRRINQDEYNELYKMLYPPVYDIELPIEY